ncbi:hypothetical protein [Kaistia adipata]|uniref:hypothetical protein n=1 Tax=Kaistia adipata TaxID=166954 RepID=UPI000417DD62|nr:hypothetical protein [Kaistia adipata]
MSNTLYMLICENDETLRLCAGRSVEGSEQDGMTSARRAAEVIVRGLYNADRVVEVWRVDLSDRTTLDVTREVAEHIQTLIGRYLRDEREDHEAAIAFVETALGVTLDGDRWVPDDVAGDWTRPYGAECTQVAA